MHWKIVVFTDNTVLFLFKLQTNLFGLLIYRLLYKSLICFNFGNSVAKKRRQTEERNCALAEGKRLSPKVCVKIESPLLVQHTLR